MKHWNKFIRTLELAASFCCVMSLFGGIALSATTPPVVTVLPVIREGAVTPTRMAQDASGNVYVTDPHAEGINVYNSVGKLLQKIITAKEPGGIAIAKNGDLLVTQGTYVAVLDPATGAQKSTFGNFIYAFSIAVDNTDSKSPGPVRASTGNVFVSDIKKYVVQAFNSSYAPLDVSAGSAHDPVKWQNGGAGNGDLTYLTNFIGDSQVNWGAGPSFFNRPAGVAIEKNTGYLAVTDSLNGKFQFFDQSGNYIAEFGQFSWDPNHSVLMFTYPQSIAFEYIGEALNRAYVLDTNQSYVMSIDATATIVPTLDPLCTDPALCQIPWTWLLDIGQYGHANGNLIVPSDILVDKKDPANNRLLVSNGFGSISVFGLASLQPYNVIIDNILNTSLRVNWTVPTSASITAIRVYRSTVAGQLGIQVGGDLPKTQTSFTDSPLAQYTKYYYTVRAVAGAETANVDQVSARTTGVFNLSININGNGSVNGTASCATGTCVSGQASDSVVTLTATATGLSVFNGWTGDCFTTSDTCIVTMDAAKFVTAFFSAKQAFRVDGAYYDNLQDAYDAAKDGSTIRALAGTWPSTSSSTEFNTAWQAKSVVIEGGYDATFSTNTGGMTVVTGRTNLNAGKVVMKQFKLK